MTTTTSATARPGVTPASHTRPTTAPAPAGPGRRPTVLRRAALVVTTALASLFAVVWGATTVAQLVTGRESDHLFHQVTGQGLLLSALWLGAVLPLTVAGWRGRAPSAAAVLHTVGFLLAAVTASAMAPVAGGPMVTGVAVVTVALLWWALPVRPHVRSLRALRPALDPVAAPVVAVLGWLHVTFAVSESAVQRAMADEHATMAHNFDMAWVSLTVVLAGLAAVLVPGARRLLAVAGAGSVVIGASRFLITDDVWWSLAATACGAVALLLACVARRERTPR
ncbi:hypothetical protein [Aquipuribacter sp. SD81]|uniref:hypothetical protein n=1 Tax=Aquipuribacter sp. SD81 TaxID=3127703 RepID=UPI00301AAABD